MGKGSLPVAEKAAEEIVSLPLYPEMRQEEIELVAAMIKNFYK
jgi:dTDP-4-amino-4,6-dideoxygalactose transaminase